MLHAPTSLAHETFRGQINRIQKVLQLGESWLQIEASQENETHEQRYSEDMTEDMNRDFIQSIDRCMAVIKAFTDGKPFMSFSELAQATSLSKPTVRRILLTLQQLGYARSSGSHFALTPKLLELGYAYLSSQDLPEIAQPLMEALTESLRLSTSLVALDGEDVVYINRVHRHRVTSITLAVGTRLPAHATASGHVLLADLSANELDEYFTQTRLKAMTEYTVTTQSGLVERLKLVRSRGWDAVDQELEIGRRSIAAPIRDPSGRVVAALSISCGTSERSFVQLCEELPSPLLDTAQKISAALGGNGYVSRNSFTLD